MATNNYILRTRVRNKADTTERWNNFNPILLSGEIAFDLQSGLFKVGFSSDGTEQGLQRYNELQPYYFLTQKMKEDIEKISGYSADGSDGLINIANTPSDWNQTDETKYDFIKNKPLLKNIATSGLAEDVKTLIDIGDGENEYTVKELITELLERLGILDNKKYVIKKEADPDKGFLASYKFYVNGETVNGSDTINIPKDYLVKSCQLKTCEVTNDPLEGLEAGDKYIDFVINTSNNDENESHLYLSVNELVDVFTGEKAINVDQSTNVITLKINSSYSNILSQDENGLAIASVSATNPGVMTTQLFQKLLNISENANNYTHPTTSGNKHIPSGGKAGQLLGFAADGTAKWQDPPEYVKTSTDVNKISITSDQTMEVNSLNITKLAQQEGDILVLDCGGADGWN